MCKIIAALLYTFVTISGELESNPPFIENKALIAKRPKYVGNEELQYVVSLGVFKAENYIHICLAVMITGLNGITAGKCGRYEYYAEKADLIECEKDLAEENRSKLHVNTKRPIHFEPDTIYTVIHFIDFDKYLFDPSEEQNYYEQPDIGAFVLKKEVQHTRPVSNVPVSTIKELPENTFFTLIGMSTKDKRRSEENMLIKKRIIKTGSFSPIKPSQIRTVCFWYFHYELLTPKDLGAPVYLEDQYVGIVVDSNWNATVAIDADLEKHIDKIIASTWFPRINERQTKGRAKASTSNAI